MYKLLLIGLLFLRFADVDRDFKYARDYAGCRQKLEQMLSLARDGVEQAEVLWRLARVSLLCGETAATKDAARSSFARGIAYADQAIQADPRNPQCYMWHCANVGRECQTRTVVEQAAAVPKMTADLTAILDRLGHTDCSEAWQALSEIWYHHPFKSTDAAVNFARKAALCIPSDELRLSTYLYLAQLLYERNRSSAKRAAAIRDNAAAFGGRHKSNIDKYALFDGSFGPGGKVPWSGRPLASLSDREEALSLLAYARERYRNWTDRTPYDMEDYRTLLRLSDKWN